MNSPSLFYLCYNEFINTDAIHVPLKLCVSGPDVKVGKSLVRGDVWGALSPPSFPIPPIPSHQPRATLSSLRQYPCALRIHVPAKQQPSFCLLCLCRINYYYSLVFISVMEIHVHVTNKPKQQSTQNWGVGNELVVICLRQQLFTNRHCTFTKIYAFVFLNRVSE